jgi:hypothetical protein
MFEASNKSLPSTKRKIPFREDFDIETINPCVSRSGQFGNTHDDSLEETATIYIRKPSLGESAGSSGIWGPRKSHIRLSHALSERAVNYTDDDVRHGSVLMSSSLKLPDAQLLEKIQFLEAKCESLHVSKKAADSNTRQVEDICMQLRQQIAELEHHVATSSNPEIQRLQDEVLVQERIARTYKEDNQRLLAQLKSATRAKAQPQEELPCQACAQISEVHAKIVAHASVADENVRLGEDCLKRGDEIYSLREENSRFRRANSSKRISGLIQTVETLQNVLKQRNPDTAFEALLSAATVNARAAIADDNQAEAARRLQVRLAEADDQWHRRLRLLRAQQDKLKVEYEKSLREMRLEQLEKRGEPANTLALAVAPNETAADLHAKIRELERQLETTKQFYLGKIKRSEPLVLPVTPVKVRQILDAPAPGNFFSADLRRFLACPLAIPALRVATAAAAAARLRSPEPLDGIRETPSRDWETSVSLARQWLDDFLGERKVRELILEEELKEACEASNCLAELATDLEISSVDRWGSAGPALQRCGVECERVLEKVRSCADVRIDPRRLLGDVGEAPSPGVAVTPGYRKELDGLIEGLNALQRQTETRLG